VEAMKISFRKVLKIDLIISKTTQIEEALAKSLIKEKYSDFCWTNKF
jgi:hypothetical protein